MFLCLQANMSVPFTITILHCLTCCPGPTLTQLRVNIVEVQIDDFMSVHNITMSDSAAVLYTHTPAEESNDCNWCFAKLLNITSGIEPACLSVCYNPLYTRN